MNLATAIRNVARVVVLINPANSLHAATWLDIQAAAMMLGVSLAAAEAF